MAKQFLYHFPAKGMIPYFLARYLNDEYIKSRTFDKKGQFLFKDFISLIALSIYDFLNKLSEFIVIRSFVMLLLFLTLISIAFMAHKILGMFLPLRTIAFSIHAEKCLNVHKKYFEEMNRKRNNDVMSSPAYKYIPGNIYHNR